MPVNGLPNTLEFLLESILDKSSLKSWNIFDDKGLISVKLRFSTNISPCLNTQDVHEGQVDCIAGNSSTNIAFKRKTTKQTVRDRQRLEEHRQNRAVTRSQAAMKDTNVKQNDIENFRSDYCSPDNSATCISPVQVQNQNESIISPNVSHSMPLPLNPSFNPSRTKAGQFDPSYFTSL